VAVFAGHGGRRSPSFANYRANVYSIMSDTPKVPSEIWENQGPQGRVILKIAPDKVNTPRSLGR